MIVELYVMVVSSLPFLHNIDLPACLPQQMKRSNSTSEYCHAFGEVCSLQPSRVERKKNIAPERGDFEAILRRGDEPKSYTSGLAYFTDVGHYLIWVHLLHDRETYTTDQPFGRAVSHSRRFRYQVVHRVSSTSTSDIVYR